MTAIGPDHIVLSMTRREAQILRNILKVYETVTSDEGHDLTMFIRAQLDHQEVP